MRRSVARVGFAASVLLGLAAVVALHDHYGVNWDEPVHSIYGDLVREWYATLGSDQRCDEFLNLRYYGPLLDLVPAVLHPVHDLGRYQLRHLLTGLLALGIVYLTWRHGRLTSRPSQCSAALAVVALIGMPRFVGHAFHNLKDIGFALAVTAWMLALSRLALRRDLSLPATLRLGAVLGFGLMVRPGGLPLFIVTLLCALMVSDALRGRRRMGGGRLLRRLAVMFVVGWMMMILPWPHAWTNPILHPMHAMAMAQRFHYSPDVLFAGEVYRSVELPRSYLPTFLAISVPLITLCLSGFGAAWSMRRLVRRRGSRLALVGAVQIAWVTLPVAAAVLTRPNLYDGMRHFLFVLPALALLAARGGERLIARIPRPAQPVGAVLVVVGLLCAVPDAVRLHPYEMTWFNQSVGGLKDAGRRYETDYWVLSYREAFEWIREHHADATPRVLVAGSPYLEPLARLYLGSSAVIESCDEPSSERSLPAGFDFCVATSRFGFADTLFPDTPVLHRVARDGVTFAVVRGSAP